MLVLFYPETSFSHDPPVYFVFVFIFPFYFVLTLFQVSLNTQLASKTGLFKNCLCFFFFFNFYLALSMISLGNIETPLLNKALDFGELEATFGCRIDFLVSMESNPHFDLLPVSVAFFCSGLSSILGKQLR